MSRKTVSRGPRKVAKRDISDRLREEYQQRLPLLQQLEHEVIRQLNIMVAGEVSLAVPIESRIKTLESISVKLGRRSGIRSVPDIQDLVGVRLIVLFLRDITVLSALLERSFKVVEREDTSERLSETEFGYSSIHYVVELLPEWLALPTFVGLAGIKFEIQVRTVAQHMWAAASHVLQYKIEANVPRTVRRSIIRTSALLETLDLEFERVLTEREAYRNSKNAVQMRLNVDSLERILDAELPAENKLSSAEQYDELVSELASVKITDINSLRSLLKKHRAKLKSHDEEAAAADDGSDGIVMPMGHYYTHTGLLREAISLEYGNDWQNEVLHLNGSMGEGEKE